ncbi:MAG: exported protein of unknown function [Modestobacter sp.]|jgi:hypothetical protein|nr:exported protein of unknown function [Modestobacter sp.]
MASAGSGFSGRAALLLTLAAGLVATVAGCSSADEPEVRDIASSFASSGPQGRCDLLAPATLTSLVQGGESCPEAVQHLPVGSGEVVSVEVWGVDAQVHLTDDTLFLTRDDTGWRVSAAACAPAGKGSYLCQVEAS